MSLGQIRNFDYAILLCNKMAETRAFYRDIMKFPVETDLERWVICLTGATGPCSFETRRTTSSKSTLST